MTIEEFKICLLLIFSILSFLFNSIYIGIYLAYKNELKKKDELIIRINKRIEYIQSLTEQFREVRKYYNPGINDYILNEINTELSRLEKELKELAQLYKGVLIL